MARTRAGRRYPTDVYKSGKQFGIWLQTWSKMPIYHVGPLSQEIKKFQVHYSNSFKKIRMLSLRIQHGQKLPVVFRIKGREFNSEVYNTLLEQSKIPVPRSMKNEILSKRLLLWQVCKKAHVLRIHRLHSSNTGLQSALARALRTNKNLKALELGDDSYGRTAIFRNLRYMQSLESIYLKQLALIPLQEFERILFASHRSLRSVTLTGQMVKTDLKGEIVKFLKTILELPNLKEFNLDTSDFDINNIPFNILKKRDISHNIRLVNRANDLRLSIPTALGLETLEFLGINCVEKWHTHKDNRDILQEQHLEAQEKARKVLFVSFFAMHKANLTDILRACNNIVTLDISLSVSTTIKDISFAGLLGLKNLRNLFLTIDNLEAASLGRVPEPITECCSADLFKNLVPLAQKLRSVQIHLAGETLPKDEKDILAFFGGCSETLTHFTFMYSCYIKIPLKKIKVFYQGLSLLKNLHSLTLLFIPVQNFTAKKDIDIGQIIKSENLRELYISLGSLRQPQISFPNLKYLQKLRLDINEKQVNRELIKKLIAFTNLKCLELSAADIPQRFWYKLLIAFQRLKTLEKIRIKYDYHSISQPVIEEVLEDFKLMKRNHESLQSIALRQIARNRETEIVWLIGSSYPNQRIEEDKFFGRESVDYTRRRTYKIYSL